MSTSQNATILRKAAESRCRGVGKKRESSQSCLDFDIDRLSRVESITNAADTETYAAYTYLGVGTIVESSRPEVTGGLNLTYGSSGTYGGFDQFGRVVDQLWEDDSSTAIDEYEYGYDAVGNRLWKENTVSSGTEDLDELYVYDEIYRLIGSDRGQLTGHPSSPAISTPDFSQSWTLDGLGNWDEFDDDGSSQTRDSNVANEITNISGGTITPQYDAAGNMTAMPQVESATDRLFAVYDGWNRLTKVYEDTDADNLFEPGANGDDDLIVTYEYDGLNRRVEKYVTAAGGGARDVDYYYDESWRLLESRVDDGTDVDIDQYIWDISYVDAPVVRYHDATDNGTYNDTGDYIHYYTFDANHNVTAAIETDGDVAARYVYDPYGKVTVYSSTWSGGSASTEDGLFFSGYYRDAETGLYHIRNRMYHPVLGNFIVRDPIGYAAEDVNLYRYVGNAPTNASDPMGLQEPLTPEQFVTNWADHIGWNDGPDEVPNLEAAQFLQPDTMFEFMEEYLGRFPNASPQAAFAAYSGLAGEIGAELQEFLGDDRHLKQQQRKIEEFRRELIESAKRSALAGRDMRKWANDIGTRVVNSIKTEIIVPLIDKATSGVEREVKLAIAAYEAGVLKGSHSGQGSIRKVLYNKHNSKIVFLGGVSVRSASDGMANVTLKAGASGRIKLPIKIFGANPVFGASLTGKGVGECEKATGKLTGDMSITLTPFVGLRWEIPPIKTKYAMHEAFIEPSVKGSVTYSLFAEPPVEFGAGLELRAVWAYEIPDWEGWEDRKEFKVVFAIGEAGDVI